MCGVRVSGWWWWLTHSLSAITHHALSVAAAGGCRKGTDLSRSLRCRRSVLLSCCQLVSLRRCRCGVVSFSEHLLLAGGCLGLAWGLLVCLSLGLLACAFVCLFVCYLSVYFAVCCLVVWLLARSFARHVVCYGTRRRDRCSAAVPVRCETCAAIDLWTAPPGCDFDGLWTVFAFIFTPSAAQQGWKSAHDNEYINRSNCNKFLTF